MYQKTTVTHHLARSSQNFESPIFWSEYLSMLNRVLLDYSTADVSVCGLCCQRPQNLSLLASSYKIFRKIINQSPEQENLKHRYDLGDTILPVLGVITTLSQHLNTPLRENSWVTTKPSSSPIPFWTYQHHKETLESHKCNDYITCCFDGLSWLALISVVNKEGKNLTCKFLHPHGLSGQFHWPRGDDRGYIPLNKVIMKTQAPTTSANRGTYFITEEKKKKNKNYFERTSV